jgi:hypothetical protein
MYKLRLAAIVICAVSLLGGCASKPSTQQEPSLGPPGVLSVRYSRGGLPDDDETLSEITIVTRGTTGKMATLTTLGAILSFGTNFRTFSKDELKGKRIENVDDRTNLQNPVSTTFIQSLQTAVDAKMAQDKIGLDRGYRYPLIVIGGFATLVYDTLLGPEDPKYQLTLNLLVYKRDENSSTHSSHKVSCDDRSAPPQPLAYWSDSSYNNARLELNRMLAICQQKVLNKLPDLIQP